jgi:hypothetical protein
MYCVSDAEEIHDGILACSCSLFPVVSGIPVLHTAVEAAAALEQLRAGRPAHARRALFGLHSPWDERFEQTAASETATFRDVVQSLGPQYEGGYFLYRFSDPSYVVAQALVSAVAGNALSQGGRAIDICGGAGHLTRVMGDLSPRSPVVADLYFAKLWLARRFTAPGCEAVCCNGNAPLPFSRGAFRYAMCADAFMFIWHKRAFVGEMMRLLDDKSGKSAAVISHTHNQLQWSPSLGQPLPPEGYRDLFETTEPRLFAEGRLFDEVVNGGRLDLSRCESPETLAADPALVLVASHDSAVFAPHELRPPQTVRGELRLNPLYAADEVPGGVRLRLQFPSAEYEEEFGACRAYLPDTVAMDRTALSTLAGARVSADLAELVRRRVILDLPKRYY